MTSKKSAKALADAEAYTVARWRYLARNQSFREGLRELAGLRSEGHEQERGLDEFSARWGFDPIPWKVLERLAGMKKGAEISFLDTQMNRVRSVPVSVTQVDRGRLAATLRVRLDHPLHFLLALVEQELGNVLKLYGKGTQRRRRLDKTDFYLGVYDRAMAGKRFSTIAKELKRPTSTIKSAFATAVRNVKGDEAVVSKQDLAMEGFDYAKHARTCRTCRRALSVRGLCRKARLWANQGWKGQTEMPIRGKYLDKLASKDP